jgi:6-phosphogluconolactonase
LHRHAVLVAALAVTGCGGDGSPAVDGGGRAWVYAGGGKTINAFDADLATGALTFTGSTEVGDEALLAEIDAAGRRVYLQTQIGNPLALLSFAIGANGALQRTGEVTLPHPMVEGVTQILLHPTAPWLLVSATGGASGLEDWLMPVSADGRLGAGEHKTIATEFYAFSWDPTGKFFFGLDGEAIFQYGFDATSGALTPSTPLQAEGSTGHPMLALRTHPNGRWIYSVEENQVGLFAFDAARGLLRAQAYVRNAVTREPMYWTSIAVHPAGRFLYVLGYVTASRVTLVDVFSIDPGDGTLTFVEREKGEATHRVLDSGLQAPLVVGDLLLVGGRSAVESQMEAPVLTVYRIDRGSGALAATGDPVPLRPAADAAVSFIFSAPR